MPDRQKPPTPLDTWDSTTGVTLFHPRRPPASSDSREPTKSGASTSLPADLREQASRRLRLIALTYALAFFLADLAPSFFTGEFLPRFTRPEYWIPTIGSIALGLVVAALAGRTSIPWERRVWLALAFEVAASYGIALAQYLVLPDTINPAFLHSLSPSWVGVWLVFFSVVLPAPPRFTLLAAIASASAPPVVIGIVIWRAGLTHLTTPLYFFLSHVVQNGVCVVLAMIGARTMYRLGKDVTRARELGSYRLEERLGQGGMGEVWRASHRLLARPAAIKFIRPDALAGLYGENARQVLKRFEREARATASLSSAHTVNLYDYGVTDAGAFYYVMELLDGFDFDELVRRFGPLPPARIVHLIAQACESLEEAHRNGLIHRDVKPANLYLCRSGTRCDFVKVLDFGLVVRDHSANEHESRLTLPDHAAGTPAYMAPEVASGQAIDGRADLYSLGCVAYWLATGQHVFEGRSAYEIVSRHLHEEPEPPSRRGATALPPELDAAILRCLEKSPDRRPAGARELARSLRRVPLADQWTDDEAEAWWSAHLPRQAKPPEPTPQTARVTV
jgi:eukaryotic-like serine/threonine-protein kinase